MMFTEADMCGAFEEGYELALSRIDFYRGEYRNMEPSDFRDFLAGLEPDPQPEPELVKVDIAVLNHPEPVRTLTFRAEDHAKDRGLWGRRK